MCNVSETVRLTNNWRALIFKIYETAFTQLFSFTRRNIAVKIDNNFWNRFQDFDNQLEHLQRQGEMQQKESNQHIPVEKLHRLFGHCYIQILTPV